jgi:hypothetical protein
MVWSASLFEPCKAFERLWRESNKTIKSRAHVASHPETGGGCVQMASHLMARRCPVLHS